MEKELVSEINRHMLFYEKQYNIHVLFWALRSSINIGIKRKNSDLDVMFAYTAFEKRVCLGIHDITGHGLDFWGIEISEILSTISINNKLAYDKKGKPTITFISPQHRRAGCSYYFGIYSTIGSPYVTEYNKFISNTCTFFLDMFERKIAVQELLNALQPTLRNIRYFRKVYLYDYLYAIWRLELSKHIMYGGMPGENNINDLTDEYAPFRIKQKVTEFLLIYKNTYSKESIFIEIGEFNSFILEEFQKIQDDILKLPYEKEDIYPAAQKRIQEYINDMCY